MSGRFVRVAGSVVTSVLIVTAAVYLARKAGGVFAHPLLAARLLAGDMPAQLPVPVQGVRSARLIDSWGFPRPGGRSHRGIDIFAPRGRPVISTTRGIVATVGTNRLGGRIVRVFGPGGYWHYYAHLERFGDVRAGQVIAQGRVIGFVGDSGNARGTPPHLHYGIYRFAGGAINPYPLLKDFRQRKPPSRP